MLGSYGDLVTIKMKQDTRTPRMRIQDTRSQLMRIQGTRTRPSLIYSPKCTLCTQDACLNSTPISRAPTLQRVTLRVNAAVAAAAAVAATPHVGKAL